jgi:hypothetical protein
MINQLFTNVNHLQGNGLYNLFKRGHNGMVVDEEEGIL